MYRLQSMRIFYNVENIYQYLENIVGKNICDLRIESFAEKFQQKEVFPQFASKPELSPAQFWTLVKIMNNGFFTDFTVLLTMFLQEKQEHSKYMAEKSRIPIFLTYNHFEISGTS